MHPPNPRKRVLLPLDANSLSSSSSVQADCTALVPYKRKRVAGGLDKAAGVAGEVGRLVVRDAGGTTELLIQQDKPFFVGRSEGCDHVLLEPSVSGKHCRVYSIIADTGEVLAMLQDTSTNGTLHNGRLIKRGAAVVLSDGDRIEIASHVFRYSHTVSSATTSAFTHAIRIGDFLVSPRTLGSGAYSQVFLALSTKTLRQVACKRLARSNLKGDRLEAIQREVEMLKKAQHPNINKIEDVVIGDKDVHIFLQLVSGGDLFSHLVKRGRLDAPEAKFILYQLLIGLRYLHEEVNVAHRDIKLENIILSHPSPFPHVLLADFGQSRSASQSFKSLNGTLQYMAPEQLLAWTRKGGYSGKKADVWGLGIVLALLLTGSHPFEPWSSSSSFASSSPYEPSPGTIRKYGQTAAAELAFSPGDRKVCEGVVSGEVLLPEIKFGSGDQAARLLLAQMLSHDPFRRATAAQALNSRWIKESKKELERLYERVVSDEQVAKKAEEKRK